MRAASRGSPRVVIVVAAAENGIIGAHGQLPWRMPSDLRQFKRLTVGKPVIMGRRTAQSLKGPLVDRDNIVITRDRTFAGPGFLVTHDVSAALELARARANQRGADEIAIIGGAEIYAAMLPQVDRIYLTRVHATPDGDTGMPPLDPTVWREVSRSPLEPDPRDEHQATLVTLDRV